LKSRLWREERRQKRHSPHSSEWRKATGARETCIIPSHRLVRPPVEEVPLSHRADVLSLSTGDWRASLQMNFPSRSQRELDFKTSD